jgi:hypothetical protein
MFRQLFVFLKSCRLCDNVEKYCTAGQATDDIMAHTTACWIRIATNTNLEYVILTAFPLQKWLHERVSMLCNTYIDCLVPLSWTTKTTDPNPHSAPTGCTFNLFCILDLRPNRLTTRYSENFLFINRGLSVAGSSFSRWDHKGYHENVRRTFCKGSTTKILNKSNERVRITKETGPVPSDTQPLLNCHRKPQYSSVSATVKCKIRITLSTIMSCLQYSYTVTCFGQCTCPPSGSHIQHTN